MKTHFLTFAFAPVACLAIAASGTACISDGLDRPDDPVMLSVRVENVTRSIPDDDSGEPTKDLTQNRTRTIKDPAPSNDQTLITLRNGYIFILSDSGGAILDREPLSEASLDANGQLFPRPIPRTAKVYVIGNVPEGIDVTTMTKLSDITTSKFEIAAITDLSTVPLSTGGFSGIAISADPIPGNGSVGTASVTVSLKPAVAILELGGVRGMATANDAMESFLLTGVYLHNYYTHANFAGYGSGEQILHEKNKPPKGSPLFYDLGEWPSAKGEDGIPVARPNPDKEQYWSYFSAAGYLPLILFSVKDFKTTTQPLDTRETFMKVTFSGNHLAMGNIYRFEVDFDPDDLPAPLPSQEVNLSGSLSVVPWTIYLDGNFKHTTTAW